MLHDSNSSGKTSPMPSRPTGYRSTIYISGISIVVALVLGYGVYRVSASSPDGDDENPSNAVRRLPVTVTKVQKVDQLPQTRRYTGTIRAKRKAELGFELTGRVAEVLVDEGDSVNDGVVLAILDRSTLLARKASMRSSLDQAKAVLAELNAGPRQEQIDSMKAQLREAESDLQLAKIVLDRNENLRGTAVADSEYDTALFRHQSASARRDSTQRQLEELTTGTRPERIAAQRAAVGQLQASLDEIETQIRKSTLLAPFAGKIVERDIDPGAIANATMPVLKIVDTEHLEARIGIPVNVANDLLIGETFQIYVGERPVAATLIAKIQEIDAATRTQNLIFELKTISDSVVLPGQLGQIEITKTIDKSGFIVPARSLTHGIRGLWSIYLVAPDTSTVVRADVQIVYTDGQQALISGPLSTDALVIADGTHRIVEGQHVEAILE